MDDEPESWLDPDFIERLKQEIETDPELRLLTDIAYRCHLPVSEVARRWTAMDLALDVAASRLRLESDMRSCPGCGVDPQMMLREDGRLLAKGMAWRLDVNDCPFCAERDETQARLAHEEYKPRPPWVRYVPRFGDEPFIDEGHTFALDDLPET